ncbi:hypothetical protein LTS17_004259 [Exophiala oligosperma]
MALPSASSRTATLRAKLSAYHCSSSNPTTSSTTSSTTTTATTPLKPLIAMSAHSALSAKIASQVTTTSVSSSSTTGSTPPTAAVPAFDAIWVSGFELSALHAVPDASIISPSTHLSTTRDIFHSQPLPLIADLDTGFGNAVNLAYALPRYEAAGTSAVVIEDKTFPKDSSLRPGGRQHLVPIPEFQAKIRAAKELSSMIVIARTEALIAAATAVDTTTTTNPNQNQNRGQSEALARALAYEEAGADAVLVHSKSSTPKEIISFCSAYTGNVPLVIVPTSYPRWSFEDVSRLTDNKVGLVICGNHAVRAAVAGMRRAFRRIADDRGIAGVQDEIASVEDIFQLQGDDELRELEKKYLP